MKVEILQEINPTFRVNPEQITYNKNDYKVVFNKEYESKPEGKTDKQICDWYFEMSNMTHLDGFEGHSLSVSDIVVIDGKAYICDSFGWKEIELA